MNIQRKYSLPNCTLLLEGLSDVTRLGRPDDLRPQLSILVNAECYLSAYNQPLSGGREFFESLVRAVSAYAQEFLSNIPHSPLSQESELVELQKINSNRHRLIINSEVPPEGFTANPNYTKQPPIQIDLNTVQLFDLVEAVDQFFADSQTLPELSLELQPVARGYGATRSLIKQTVPATVGVSSLAVAAFAFSLIPAPQIRPPEVKPQEQANTTVPLANTTPSAEVTPTTTISPLPEVTPTTTPSSIATPTPLSTAPTKDLEVLLNTSPEISDPSQLRELNRQVYNLVHPAWTNRAGLKQDLIYRLGVSANGVIIGYKAVNKEANEGVGETPLPNLLYNPVNNPQVEKEPIAQFRVVFTKQRVLEVSPWSGYQKKPEVFGEKIRDPKTVKDLNEKLYNSLRQNWNGTHNFTRDLKYRVAVNKEGILVDYESLNQAAFDYPKETPLPTLLKPANLAQPNSKEPLAHFQIVFKPDGKLEVTPWRGY